MAVRIGYPSLEMGNTLGSACFVSPGGEARRRELLFLQHSRTRKKKCCPAVSRRKPAKELLDREERVHLLIYFNTRKLHSDLTGMDGMSTHIS